MELLETQDPEKRKLIETSNRHRLEMDRELKDISNRTEKILKNALIIGGVLALTYIVINQLSSAEKKPKKKEKSSEKESSMPDDEFDESPSLLSKMGDKAINMAAVILLDLAKEKLSQFLQPKKLNENS